LFIPIHPVVIISYLTFMTLTAISNHLGVELFKWPLLQRHFISGTHHALHHKRFNGNYGLYYCFMDRLGKTEIQES
ncbi:MAG: sterol desaturase family protein, partial [Bdellovibrionales bacterium]|nr:sterol desaturase family protein [Bdellovibrionales bacterium]